MSDDLTCYYHENRKAIGHCERCSRLVCLECQRKYRVRHSRGRYHHGYVERYEYCPICYYNRKESPGASCVLLFPLCFLSIFIIVPISTGMFMEVPVFSLVFISIPTLIAASILYSLCIYGPKERERAHHEKLAFMKEVGLDDNYNKGTPQTEQPRSEYRETLTTANRFYCAQCGKNLQVGIKFCPNCGDSTADEMATLKK